ncbi:hypothetical protein PV721_22165 [Streptomyces sp. MB09-01]|uniref:hypothetical protein n=1 Tax=Streptomyces sp. MB09-01 TaxID=3028666 RepID=UPI0029BB19A2|nr:hypothetical protein [Streptomyces sp. MB09-01]MDX3537029.1 hypothetical protein [Streptomyces sp. MB09-01]
MLDRRGHVLPIGPVLAGWNSLHDLVLRGNDADCAVTPDDAGPVGLSRHRGLRSVALGDCWASRHPAEWQELPRLTGPAEPAEPAAALDLPGSSPACRR